MSKSAQAIESAALLLPRKERARLAERLIASLEEQDPEVEAAWAAEIRRRMDEWEAGLVDEIPWDEARRQIEQRLSRPRLWLDPVTIARSGSFSRARDVRVTRIP